jgi:hypothetical protein
MKKATAIILADGSEQIVEHGKGRCWASEETDEITIEVADDTKCDICEEVF